MSDLKQALYDAVSECLPEGKIAVAFSGGVDSSLLAKICRDIGKQVVLITVGFSGSNDIEFAKRVATKMDMECQILEIDYNDFVKNLHNVRQTIKCENTSHIENCIGYFYICKLARQNGVYVVLSANGCDELFCGYDSYRRVYTGGQAALNKLMDEKIANEFALIAEISTIARQFGVEIRQPFLSSKFIMFAKTIPIDQKIKGPEDLTRKHVLRQAALSIGVSEESATRPKKALQYGSLIHKYFKRANT